jgi:hypothetical protein
LFIEKALSEKPARKYIFLNFHQFICLFTGKKKGLYEQLRTRKLKYSKVDIGKY